MFRPSILLEKCKKGIGLLAFLLFTFQWGMSQCTAPILTFQNPALVSGSAGAVGAVYQFDSVLPGINARVTILSKSHSDIAVLSLDEPAATNGGYDYAFQPIIDYNWLNSDGTYDSGGDKSMTFQFDFIDASTGGPASVPNMSMTAVDVDGNDLDVREFVQCSDFQSYELQTPTDLTISGALKALGNVATFAGVDETALSTMVSFRFDNPSSVVLTYGGNYDGVGMHDDASEGRMNCLYFKCYNFNTTVTCPSVSVTGGGSFCSGSNATLTASVANGTGTCNIQWQSSADAATWTDIPGATATAYSVAATSTLQYYRAGYFCSDQATCGVVASNIVSVISSNCGGPCDNGPDDQTSATNTLVPAGSYIIDMGVMPQTISNALKPYGLVWELLENHQVPVLWSINPGKAKDGIDFSYNGNDFKGGPFIITAEQRSAAVNAVIANWESQGVVGVTTSTDITVPVNRILNYSMHWTLDLENGAIAEQFLMNAGIPASAYDWVLPGSLSCCNDIFVMPHATPTWATHSNLLSWNDCELNGGCAGAIWTGCRAASNIENLFNPADPSQKMNFLMMAPIAPATTPAVVFDGHADGTMPYQHEFHDHPIMQFMGLMDGGQENGSEQIYLPTTGWRPSTHIGIWDPDHPDLGTLSPGPAAKVVFGPAFGQTGRGYVAYEAGHDIAKSTTPAFVAAQRAFFNFSFMALGEKSIKPVSVVPNIVKSGNAYQLSASATGGSGNYTFSWASSCGGSFDNSSIPNAVFTAPVVSSTTTCTITLEVTDDCGVRSSFNTIEITVDPPSPEICDNELDDDGDGLTDCADPDCPCFNAEYEFCTYNLDLPLGTTFNIRDFVHRKNSIYGPDFTEIYFTYTAAGANNPTSPADWHLVDFNNGNDVTVVAADAAPGTGNKNNGEYRIYLVRNGQTNYDDFMTIRVGLTSNVASAKCDFEICGNGLDDDGDGLIDCDDPECSNGLTANVLGGATICAGASTNLSVAGTGGTMPYTFTWSNGLGTGSIKSVTTLVTTDYTVTVSDANGCTAIGSVTINVNPAPTADAGLAQNLCSGLSTTLNASATGGTTPYTYTWDNGLGNGISQSISPLATTTYTVTVSSPNGCNDTDQVTVTVATCVEDCGNGIDDDGDGLVDCDDPDCGPTVDAGSNLTICPGTNAFLSATGSFGKGSYTYAWSNGFNGQSQTVTPLATTTYTVTITSNGSGCTSTDQVTVTIGVCSENCTNGIDDDGDGLIDCDDPDCMLTAAPALVDDAYTTCPGLPMTERVTYNDENLQNPVYSIAVAPANGSVSIDGTGKFTYTPSSTDCMVDQFTYQACNAASGCCSQAVVTITLGDTEPPVLNNVPADLTIGCDDAVPDPPQITAFDACPGIYIDFEETSDQHFVGACGSYTLTRTWTATDLCGNTATGLQHITVVDQTAPEIFQVYTLANGKRIVAGVAKRVTHDWKYVPFPITFGETPMIFSTIVSENEMSAVSVRHRNSYSQGFELRLFEEEAADGLHAPENVAWIAVEQGTNTGSFAMEAGKWMNINNIPSENTFSALFGANPGILAAIQSANDTDPANLRFDNIDNISAELFVHEETSNDPEQVHGAEDVGYLAFRAGENLQDSKGQIFGETGQMNLTNAWSTITLNRAYSKPVVVLGGLSNNDVAGVNIRVRNVTANSFEARIQEWDYLDGNHPVESVSWMVMEGSIPGDQGYYCSGSIGNLQVGLNVFSIDNCDDQVSFGYNETVSVEGNGTLTTRVWVAVDDCGNTSLVTRYDTCATAALQVKALLYGPLSNNGGTGLMRDDLRSAGLVPVREPFSALPAFPHVEVPTGMNNGAGNGPAMVTVCHKPGTPAQHTITIPETALAAHLAHGDTEGSCSGDTGNSPPAGASSAAYVSIADGAWDSPATWQGGSVPPTGNLNNNHIAIYHQVALTGASLNLHANSALWVLQGGLTMDGGTLTIRNATAVFQDASLNLNTGFLKLDNPNADLQMLNCQVNIGGNFQIVRGQSWMENTCLTVNGQIDNRDKMTFVNTSGVVGTGLINTGQMEVSYSKFDLKFGNFDNAMNATMTGDGLIVWVENGSLQNTGTWSTSIIQYCVGAAATGIGADLPAAEDCGGMTAYFATCDMLIGPDGMPGTGLQVFNSQTISPADILGRGTIDPAMLQIAGNTAVVDWMLLELRDPADEKEIVDYATVILQRDGNIVSEDGGTVINFPNVLEGDYLVTLRHRNHMAMMTALPVHLSILNPPLVDFTDEMLPIKGSFAGGKSDNGLRTMWAGDLNGDDKVIYQGPNNDIFYLFSRVLGDNGNMELLANYIVVSYDVNDLNLDGRVIYQGPQNDRASLLYYTILSHPSNTNFLANYIAVGVLP